ncbi:hypothetical protein mgb1_008 [Bacillus phage MG-B1]|uniref:Uncharacterized protein n=1 Tax=Bacillus phage MG-B1 TaxID=1309583 RepID=M4W8B7_9CAUD|nr:hypothetical protein mgb1_008 [Bacillus phage MG-B1]AGI10597.1 hypothetical protein mgb1_008 [Bacillus phage MG-B1]
MKSRELKYIKRKKMKRLINKICPLFYKALSGTPTMDGNERDMSKYGIKERY